MKIDGLSEVEYLAYLLSKVFEKLDMGISEPWVKKVLTSLENERKVKE